MFKNFELTKKTGCREIPRFYFCIMGSFQCKFRTKTGKMEEKFP